MNNLKRYTKDQFYLNANSLLDEFASGNSKSYWSLMKKLVKTSGNSTHITQLKNENDELVTENYDKACLLNKYFCSISTINENNDRSPEFLTRSNSKIDIFYINSNQVIDILQTLKLGKASGNDSISHQMLKKTSYTVSVPLSLLFNLSFEKAEFPSQWKTAIVMPLFKTGDKSLVSNYRPISLLSAVGKVFERIVFKNVFNHLIANNLLYKFQSGFIPGHSTVHQLIEIYYRICM